MTYLFYNRKFAHFDPLHPLHPPLILASGNHQSVLYLSPSSKLAFWRNLSFPSVMQTGVSPSQEPPLIPCPGQVAGLYGMRGPYLTSP